MKTFWISILLILLLAPMAFGGEQEYVGRYHVYTGYMYLNSPLIKLGESGFHTQAGISVKRWYSLGFDFSTGTGDTALVPNMLKTSLQQEITKQIAPLIAAGYLPRNYAVRVPMHSTSQTFAIGPQLAFRHFSSFTIFVRPDLGAIHEQATPHPGDPITRALVAKLSPSPTKVDWTYFYGFGGGVDLRIFKHLTLRLQADFVRDHLYDDLLYSRNSVRFSIGPTFHFGPNVPSH